MVLSRFGRLEERKAKKRLLWAIAGSAAVLLFLGIFGLRILVAFSVFVDKIRGNTPATQQSQVIILPPILDPLPIATNSASMTISGRGEAGLTAIVYINEVEKRRTEVDSDGTFTIKLLTLAKGKNTIRAKLSDEKDNVSDLSEVLTITVETEKPKLEISSPEDGATIRGEDPRVNIEGFTDADASVTVNDRVVVVESDGSFRYTHPLNTGDNILKIVATDQAGNITLLERMVKYER